MAIRPTGHSAIFCAEADEYDTSYFDRRSKFVHYRPRTLIVNNLEYDHADIFPDISNSATVPFMLRTVPSGGLILAPSEDDDVNEVLHQFFGPGCQSGGKVCNSNLIPASIGASRRRPETTPSKSFLTTNPKALFLGH